MISSSHHEIRRVIVTIDWHYDNENENWSEIDSNVNDDRIDDDELKAMMIVMTKAMFFFNKLVKSICDECISDDDNYTKRDRFRNRSVNNDTSRNFQIGNGCDSDLERKAEVMLKATTIVFYDDNSDIERSAE